MKIIGFDAMGGDKVQISAEQIAIMTVRGSQHFIQAKTGYTWEVSEKQFQHVEWEWIAWSRVTETQS